MEKNKEIEAVDLGKVIDIAKLRIKPNQVLVKVVSTTKSNLLIPAHMQSSSTSYPVIDKVGEAVKDIKVGDVVVDMLYNGAEYLFKEDDHYILLDAYNIFLWTELDNYDLK